MIKLILKLKGTQIEEFTLKRIRFNRAPKEKEPNIRLPRKSPSWKRLV